MRDRYHAIICYHCQRYGHIESKCTATANGENPVCYKCAGEHKAKDCPGTERKCINCVRYKKPEVNHSVNNQCCVVFQTEIERIRNMTDHGY